MPKVRTIRCTLMGPRGIVRRYVGRPTAVANDVYRDLARAWRSKGYDMRHQALEEVRGLLDKEQFNFACLGWNLSRY